MTEKIRPQEKKKGPGKGGARKGAGLKGGEALKWKTPEARRAACESFCQHLRAGYSEMSWPEADEDTVYRYMKNYPDDFCPKEVNKARRESKKFWEGVGIAGTTGKLKGFNAMSWNFNMKNRLGWADKHEITGKDGKDLNPDRFKIQVATDEEAMAAYLELIREE